MALDFKSHIFQSFAEIPSYSTWLVHDADLTPTLGYQRRVMKLLAWGEPQRPWRLKCPSHVLWLDALNAAFPDARFVMTHRDPTDVILSVADLYADIIGSFSTEIHRHYIGRLNVEHWSLGMERALKFRADGAEDRPTTSTFVPCRTIRSVRSTACMRGWAPRWARNSKHGCRVGGSKLPASGSRAHTRTRFPLALISTRCGPGSRRMSRAHDGGPHTERQGTKDI